MQKARPGQCPELTASRWWFWLRQHFWLKQLKLRLLCDLKLRVVSTGGAQAETGCQAHLLVSAKTALVLQPPGSIWRQALHIPCSIARPRPVLMLLAQV